MKRILYLTRGGTIGGSQRQLHYVVKNLNHGYEPIVVCRRDGQFFGRLRDSDIATDVLPLRPWRKFPAMLYRYMDAERLVKFAREHKVVLVHSSDLWLSGYLNWVAGRLKIPSVLHVRTPIRPEEVRKHRCDRATSIIAISRRVRRNLISGGISPRKITVIDDMVDLESFDSKSVKTNVLRRDFSINGQVLVGIVGRIGPSKRQLEFLRAARQIVRDMGRNVTFFVIGPMYSREYFKKLKRFVGKSGLNGYVVFTDRRDDMPQVLSSLDILVSLSGGSVMFEAMACGKAVVSAGFSTKEDSVHIQDGRTGLLVSSRRQRELVRVLRQLITTPELRMRIGRQARKWAEKKFSHIELAARTEQLYEQLMQS
jgi:glycosyltransferase involved in cell wall biosynthesis